MASGETDLEAFHLDVGDGHRLFGEIGGAADGLPVVVLHGGPGAGSKPSQRLSFAPDAYRVVTFDQRGCGRSTPSAELNANTTQHLVADIEAIRVHLGIERWLVAGGSWGSFLALAYAEAHPDRCLGLRLNGIFLASREEIDWWFQGVRAIHPDRWEAFAGFVHPEERDDLLAAYHRRLVGPDHDTAVAAAMALRGFSAATQTFLPEPAHIAALTSPEAALPLARLFAHYCVHRAFLPAGQLLRDLDRVRHLPAEIVHGRYDTVTPLATAWRLASAWPEARLTIVDAANHVATASAPDMLAALTAAADRLRARISQGQAA
jgi:proline iminopeptidase